MGAVGTRNRVILQENESDCILLHLVEFLLIYSADFMFAGYINRNCTGTCRTHVSLSVVTGHLDTGFSWFPCVYKEMLRWFTRFQVAATCLTRVTAFGLDTNPSCLHLTSNQQQLENQKAYVVTKRYCRELLMMGVMVPETC